MAFAAGVQELLLQSHTGTVCVFPAMPSAWKDASFATLRAVGAFLVNARLKDGCIANVRVKAEKGGRLRLASPLAPGGLVPVGGKAYTCKEGIVEVDTRPGEVLEFVPKR